MVRNRQYLRRFAPHRNHTLHADHTDVDVWAIADHRSTTPIRPSLTVTVDGHSGLIHAYLWPSRPTGKWSPPPWSRPQRSTTTTVSP